MFSADSTRLYSPLLDLTDPLTPTLQFWMYHDTGYAASNDRVQVQISTDDETSYSTLATAFRFDGSTGWKRHTIDLSAYAGQNTIRLGFLGISAFGNNIFIDDISVGTSVTADSYTVFLPVVIKSPTPSEVQHWVGTTTRGYPMSFDVSSGDSVWSNFILETDFLCGTIEITVSGPASISKPQ